MGAPVITIFVRHTAGCKHANDEFSRRCKCRKHLRWTQGGTQYRRKTGTRSWEEAETIKDRLQDELAGRKPMTQDDSPCLILVAIELFIKEKKVEGIGTGTLKAYVRELGRFRVFCDHRSVFTVAMITRELLVDFVAGWREQYPSSKSRNTIRQRLKTFLKYCFNQKWLDRIPPVPIMKAADGEESTPTLPLTDEEYTLLLKTSIEEVKSPELADRVHALFQLMRYSGLSLTDALTLPKDRMTHDPGRGLYRIVTSRQKTKVDVTVPIPQRIGKEILAACIQDSQHFFWSGKGKKLNHTQTWTNRYVRPVFKAAGLYGDCFTTSHRLRDTFAVDLLSKGVPLEEVSKMLGHKSVKTTEEHYAKWVKSRQDRLDTLVMETWAEKPRRMFRPETHGPQQQQQQ